MGFVGRRKAGSSPSTSTWVSTRDHWDAAAALFQRLAELLLQLVADIALAHGAANVEGHGRSYVRCCLGGQEDAPHLGSVAVDEGQLIARLGERGEVFGRALGDLQLRLSRGREGLSSRALPPRATTALVHGFIGRPPYSVATRTALMVCMRFSASSKTTLWRLRKTSSSTSQMLMPFSSQVLARVVWSSWKEGRQCR